MSDFTSDTTVDESTCEQSWDAPRAETAGSSESSRSSTIRESQRRGLPVDRRTVLKGSAAAGLAAATPAVMWDDVGAATEEDPLVFASVPDMFNWDIPNPQSGWEDALDWFFDELTATDAEFVLSAGDIMDARWWEDEQQVQSRADIYWTGFKQRFDDRNLPVYIAPGDHERGDNDWPDWKLDLVPTFEQKFVEIFDHPTNGPPGKEELAFSFVHDNALFVTVDTWELHDGEVQLSVSGDQLAWFEDTLSNHQDKDFIIVQGHTPVISGVNTRNSSGLYLDGGRSSAFWQAMIQYGVDVYLCGEHHAITTDKVDGIWQVVHGSLWGTHTDLNYLVGRVGSETLELELREFNVSYDGGYIDHINRSDTNAPREIVNITDSTQQNGSTTVESIVIDSSSDEEVEGCPVVETVPDLSENGNPGTLVGDVAHASGYDGQGMVFNGGYISVPESASVDVQQPPLTVECWVNPTDPVEGGNGYEPYVTKVGESGQYSLHRTSLDNEANGQLEFAVSSGGEFYTPRSPVPSDWQGTWHHLAGVFDGTAVKLYVDGTEADSVPFSGTLADTTSDVEIGRNFGHQTRKVTDGTVIDRVRIHRAALAAGELDGDDPASAAAAVLWFDFESIDVDGPTAPTSDSYLSNLEAIDYTVGYTFDDFGRDEAVTGNPLQVDGETYDIGIGTHAPSHIRYCLGGTMGRFQAEVGRDEKGGEFAPDDGNGVIFRVLGDGNVLAATDPVTGDMSPVPIDVDVTGVHVLTLVADDNGDSSYDHADWLNARVSTYSIPEAVAGSDGTISLTEIQQAIDWWASETQVPGTGGEQLGHTDVLQLINMWATGATVETDTAALGSPAGGSTTGSGVMDR